MSLLAAVSRANCVGQIPFSLKFPFIELKIGKDKFYWRSNYLSDFEPHFPKAKYLIDILLKIKSKTQNGLGILHTAGEVWYERK